MGWTRIIASFLITLLREIHSFWRSDEIESCVYIF